MHITLYNKTSQLAQVHSAREKWANYHSKIPYQMHSYSNTFNYKKVLSPALAWANTMYLT